MSHGKQITLYTHAGGGNGWKVAFVLEELGLTYESIYLSFDKQEQKAPEYTKYNPNGRIPTIIDHKNNDFVLWESAAIITYLTEKYDPEHKVSAATDSEKYEQLQWLSFQVSGQGPYFGQSSWFQFYHKERHPDAVERYNNEIVRVLGVLDGVLATKGYLVGGRPTVADFSFVHWNLGVQLKLMPSLNFEEKFPALAKWHDSLMEREAFKKTHVYRDGLLQGPRAK